jgi:hypothetical protein
VLRIHKSISAKATESKQSVSRIDRIRDLRVSIERSGRCSAGVRCLGWVKPDPPTASATRPLYLDEQSFRALIGATEMCQKTTFDLVRKSSRHYHSTGVMASS